MEEWVVSDELPGANWGDIDGHQLNHMGRPLFSWASYPSLCVESTFVEDVIVRAGPDGVFCAGSEDLAYVCHRFLLQ